VQNGLDKSRSAMQTRLDTDGLGQTKRSNWHSHRLLTGHEKQRLAVRHAQTGATSTV
jgi:hypothetical protein